MKEQKPFGQTPVFQDLGGQSETKKNRSGVEEQLERTQKIVALRERKEALAAKNLQGAIIIFSTILGVAIGVKFGTALGFAAFAVAVLWKMK